MKLSPAGGVARALLLFCMIAGVSAGRALSASAAQENPETPAATTPAASPSSEATQAVATPTKVPDIAPSPVMGNWRFGVIESYEDPAMAARLGVAWTRVRFQWAEVQAGGPDTWTPAFDDEAIDREIAAGREVIGLLIGLPRWARDRDGLPKGLWLPPDDPGNTWAGFVREAVSRYDGRIDHWVIWNEPDIDDPDAPGHTWDGTLEDFVQLQRVAYLTAKETNPQAVIHLAAFTHFWDPDYFDRFLDALVAAPGAADNRYYFDAATAHLYFQPSSIYEIIRDFYGAMARHGVRKPIWLVETNAPPLDDAGWPVKNWTLSVTIYEQAAFIPQALASALAAGAQRIAVYKLKDTEDDRPANPEPFGLLRADGSRRPAYDTYRVAVARLSGASGAVRERWDGVGQIRVDQADRTTTVLFARLPAPQQALVAATSQTAELVDMWGKRTTIRPRNGVYTIDLPPALCTQSIGDYCMIGGTTYYLVQARNRLSLLPAEPTAPRPSTEQTPPATATQPQPAEAMATPAPTVATTGPVAPATGTPTTLPTVQPAPADSGTPVAAVINETTAGAAPSGNTDGPATNAGEYSGFLFIGAGLLAASLLGLWLLRYGRGR